MTSYSSRTKEIIKRAVQIGDSNYEQQDLNVILHELPLDVQPGYYLVNGMLSRNSRTTYRINFSFKIPISEEKKKIF